jgi:zinc/manganese transport system substrate-binding protein
MPTPTLTMSLRQSFRHFHVLLCAAALCAATLAAPTGAGAQPVAAGPLPATGRPLEVVASFSILADLAQRVGGERVRVHALVGAGADAHVYQPTAADARLLGRAALVVVNGLGFEGWIDRLIASAGYRGPRVVASAGVVPLTASHEGHGAVHGHAHGHRGAGKDADPHAWQDLANARRYVDNIAAALTAADPAGAAVYAANAAAYKTEIDALDAEIRKLLGALAPERRTVVTSHDAFAYFARAYGMRFVAPAGASTDSEATAADVAKLIRQIRREKIPAVFLENVSDPRLLERIRAESGARIGGTLYSDALSAASGPAATYLAMMRHNAKTLAEALAP